METEEIMENEEVMDENAEFESEETERSGGSGLGKGVVLGAALVGAGFALKKGFSKIKPIVESKLAERKAKKAEKKASKANDAIVIDDAKVVTKTEK